MPISPTKQSHTTTRTSWKTTEKSANYTPTGLDGSKNVQKVDAFSKHLVRNHLEFRLCNKRNTCSVHEAKLWMGEHYAVKCSIRTQAQGAGGQRTVTL